MTIAEDRLFLIKKAPIIAEHIDAEQKLVESVAARGYVSAPGHAHKQIFRLEWDTKRRLDEANLAVMQESLQHYLRGRGVELDREALDARLAFDIEKSELVSALTRELADLRRGRAFDSHSLDLLSVELTLREIALSYIETGTRSEIEALRLAELGEEARVFPAEDELSGEMASLSAARVELATEKLRIIDPIRDLIAQQQLVLDHERDTIMPATMDLIDAKDALIQVQENDLLPAMQELSVVISEWATERPPVIDKMIEKASAVTGLADRESALTVYMIGAATARLSKAQTMMQMLPYREEIANTQITRAINLALQASQEVSLAEAEFSLASKQAEKIGPLTEKAQALTANAEKQSDVIEALLAEVGHREQIAAVKLLAAGFLLSSSHAEVATMIAEIDVEEARTGIDLVRTAIDILKRGGEGDRATTEVAGLLSLELARESDTDNRSSKMTEAVASRESRVSRETSERLRWREAVARIKVGAGTDLHNAHARDRYREQVDVADIAATRELSSKLIHQIS